MIYGRRYLSTLARTFATAGADQVIVKKPENGQLAVVQLMASVPDGLAAAPTVVFKDGANPFGRWSAPVGDTRTLISAPSGLPIAGDLVAQVSHTGVRVSAWVIEVTGD